MPVTLTEVQGFHAKLQVDGVNYNFQKARVRHTVSEASTTHSEGLGFGESKDCIERLEIEFTQASYDPNNNPFTQPIPIVPRSIHTIVLSFDELIHGTYVMPHAQIFDLSGDIDTENLSPITFTAKSQGSFAAPDPAIG
jgi:hypothetical protein